MSPQNAPPAREYEYRPAWSKVLGAGAFFALAAGVLGYRATTIRGGRGVSEVAAEGGAAFYWVLFALSLGLVVAT